MLDELILELFMAAIYQADEREKFDASAVLAHHAIHVVAMYDFRHAVRA